MKVDRNKLTMELGNEMAVYEKEHKKSQALFEKAKQCILLGQTHNWQNMWSGNFPIYVQEASGCHIKDVDGKEYIDFCMGDTGAMTGHTPASINEITEKMKKGTTFMLPTEDHIWVCNELKRRFGLPYWQFALSASDANRFAIRWARFATKRKKVLVFNHCYHGTVDETLAQLYDYGVGAKEGNLGWGVELKETTKVVEWNDEEGLKEALKDEDVALVLAEPALTNTSIVPAKAGYLELLREETRKTGTLLLMDETHTISEGIGGFTRKYSLAPDMLTIGKPIGSGIPVAVYGFSSELAETLEKIYPKPEEADCLGIGTTLTGTRIAASAIRATLEKVLTEEAYEKMHRMANRFAEGLRMTIEEYDLPWQVILLGARLEYLFTKEVPANGTDVYESFHDFKLHEYLHLALLNRGIIITPFHNMALMCPDTEECDVDKHTKVFHEVIGKIVS